MSWDERALTDRVGALEDAVRDLVAALAPHAQGCEVCKKMMRRWAGLIRSVKNTATDPIALLTVDAHDPLVEQRGKLADALRGFLDLGARPSTASVMIDDREHVAIDGPTWDLWIGETRALLAEVDGR